MNTRALRSLLALLAVLLSACTTVAPPPAAPLAGADEAVRSWASVLKRFVDEHGDVDFARLASDRGELDRYVRYLAATPLESVADGSPRLAHMINAYNALSMFNVIDSGIPQTHAGFNKVSFFVLRRFNIGGRSLSLRGFENDIIRPYARARADPRIHFALNCSARACPVLPRIPFSGEGLDAELERDTRAFFARTINFRVDAAARTVWLSELLDFYPEDFVPGPAPSLLVYANRYVREPAPPDFEVRFTPYDWTIANRVRAAPAGRPAPKPAPGG